MNQKNAAISSFLDPATADLSIRPQDDLYRYINGTWLAQHTIPSDRPSDGAFHALHDQSEERCRSICEDSVAGKIDDPDASRIAFLWEHFMDETTVEALGATPLIPERDAITQAPDHMTLAKVMGTMQREGVDGLISLWVGSDPHDSSRTLLNFSQSGLGLPDEAYYREDAYEPIREAYRTMLQRMLILNGRYDSEKAATESAERIFNFESAIAAHHQDAVSNRDPLSHDNPMTITDLEAQFQGFPWRAWLRAVGAYFDPNYVVNISHPAHMKNVAKLWEETDINTLKDWLLAALTDTRAPFLSSQFVEARFDFHGRTLSGTQELRPRWKRALSFIEGALGESLGRLWVQRHFPPEAKEKMEKLVSDLLEAYSRSFDTIDWLSESTRDRAKEKLATFMPKIGYPDKWKDYSALNFDTATNLVEAVRLCAIHSTRTELDKLNHPVDRTEWFMTPQTVNAYYNPQLNEIVFPAAILQPPFFDPDADEAVNFGAIGSVIGHEIGHGFDDSGSRFDAHGHLENWWEDADRTRFEERTQILIQQYDALIPADLRALYEKKENTESSQEIATENADPLTLTPEDPALIPHVNGALTIGENIGDLGGLTIAWSAYMHHLRTTGNDMHTRDSEGISGAQRFFFSWARIWRTKTRPEFAQQLLAVDPHAPAEFRCNQIVQHLEGFIEAFDVKPGDGLWLEPESRVRIW
ncbi:M13 family metallopeptidase [Schaalia sp. lx-260]|uniref:M13 family metallopeptidase n=1 Tax=Schaalia sp. lx-260 TaxID=2899082 RepID=UPI001E3852DF|nr:M13-type metalloendopeptidase [Schaalia sp. lx-260]MCD4549290.1 peptidase M13 [Schaalia sp. lx-260]